MRHTFTLREAMVYVSEMAQISSKPYCLRWDAKWWRLHARESKNSEGLRYARNLMALFNDMVSRPEHYTSPVRPAGTTDWQWSGLQSTIKFCEDK